MTRDQAVAQIQQTLGWRSDKATEIVAALQFAQAEREKPGKTLPWWLVAQDQTLSVVISTQETTLPTGFIKERETRDGNLRYRPSATGRTYFLEKMDFMYAEKYFFGDWRNASDEDASADDSLSPGIPRAYVLRNTTVRIYPVPDAAYSLKWDFYKNDDTLSSGSTENKWLANAPWVLIGDAGMKLAADLRDQTALGIFSTIRTQFQSELMNSIIEREEAGRSRSMGSRL